MRISSVIKVSVALAAFIFPLTVSPLNAAGEAPKKLKLLWADEFNGKKGAPDPKVWDYDLGNSYGWGNAELEYYTKSPSNVKVDGKGKLIITANRISDQSGFSIGTAPGTEQILNTCWECQFTSAKIKTAKKLSLQYGRLEIRMKTPVGVGTWPAFWLLGNDLLTGSSWPECGEIDVLEARGYQPQLAFGTVHGPGYSGGIAGSQLNNVTPLSDDFHIYAIEWKKDQIKFFVDDLLYYTADPTVTRGGRWVFNQKFYMILNLAMGGNFTGDIDPTVMSAQMSIDYIRYYSINGTGKVTKG